MAKMGRLKRTPPLPSAKKEQMRQSGPEFGPSLGRFQVKVIQVPFSLGSGPGNWRDGSGPGGRERPISGGGPTPARAPWFRV